MTESDNCLAVDLHDVAKTYRGRVHALRGIEMQVARGEIHGLLGPNGAGKSTLMKIMMTVVRPSLARGSVLGKPIGHRATLERIGYLPENHRQPPYLTARQALDYYGALSKVDRPTRRRRTETLLQLVGMTDWADKKIGTFSKGMQQRIGLAQALINSPDLVLLDEPTDGLDPVGRREIRQVLKHLRSEGKTVFLNSHLLSEVELVCDRVAILTAGQVVRQGTIDELTAPSLNYEILVSADSTDDLGGKIREALGCKLTPAASPSIAWTTGSERPSEPIQSGLLPSGETVEVAGGRLRVLTPHAAAVQPLIDSLRQRGLIIESVRPIRQSLEDFFIGFVERASNGPVTAELVEQGGRS